MSLPVGQIATIYGIRDDRDGKYRWVGRTTWPLHKRLLGHKNTPDGTLYSWIAEVGAENVSIHALGEGTAADERAAIQQLHGEGHPLLNKAHLHGWPRKQARREGVLRNRLCR